MFSSPSIYGPALEAREIRLLTTGEEQNNEEVEFTMQRLTWLTVLTTMLCFNFKYDSPTLLYIYENNTVPDFSGNLLVKGVLTFVVQSSGAWQRLSSASHNIVLNYWLPMEIVMVVLSLHFRLQSVAGPGNLSFVPSTSINDFHEI